MGHSGEAEEVVAMLGNQVLGTEAHLPGIFPRGVSDRSPFSCFVDDIFLVGRNAQGVWL